MLLLTFQFVWQARQAQIDATLCFLTTLSLVRPAASPVRGALRSAGSSSAGRRPALGIITKGVGFLPLLILIPFVVLAARGWPATAPHRDARWFAGPVVHARARSALWFVPMMLVTAAGGELLQYRNEILFHQTVTRYAEAWHHHEPFWYYLVKVIPVLWLPLIALVPWLWPRWRAALRSRDTFVAVLLAWVVIVVLFFSMSSGKRGVYVLPALPALAMAAAPWLPELLRALQPRRLALRAGVAADGWCAARRDLFRRRRSGARRISCEQYDACTSVASRHRRPLPERIALAVFRAARRLARLSRRRWRPCWLTVGLVVYPRIDDARSGRAFMHRVEKASEGIAELGLVGAKEQYLLQLRRPSINFGHARWRERENEAADAAAWFAAKPGRALLMDDQDARVTAFKNTHATEMGSANRAAAGSWSLAVQPTLLVAGAATCVAPGSTFRQMRQ